jgi:hypothetical protein
MRCSIEAQNRLISSVLSMVWWFYSGGEVICGVLLVELRDHVSELGLLSAVADHGKLRSSLANHTTGRSAENGGRQTATLDTSADGKFSAASLVLRGHRHGLSMLEETTT